MATICYFLVNPVTFLHFVTAISPRNHNFGPRKKSLTRGPAVLKRSPDLLNNVKIGQDQLRLIMKHIFIYGGYGHFG